MKTCRSFVKKMITVVLVVGCIIGLTACQSGPKIGVVDSEEAPAEVGEQAFMDEVEGRMKQTLKDIEEIVGPGDAKCYKDGTTIVLDYWVNDTDTLLKGYISGITIDGVTHFDALTEVGGVMAQYYNAFEDYGLDKNTDYMVKLLHDGDNEIVLIYWVNGKLEGNAITGYTSADDEQAEAGTGAGEGSQTETEAGSEAESGSKTENNAGSETGTDDAGKATEKEFN